MNDDHRTPASDAIPVHRSGVYLKPDQSRTLLRPFVPGGDERARRIMPRILKLPEAKAEAAYRAVCDHFGDQHAEIEKVFEARFDHLSHLLPESATPTPLQRRLIGSYFTSEYALQSAALFNPSIVPHPDQSGVADGALRFVMSLRATGEGHVSSIEFRSGVVYPEGRVEFEDASPWIASCPVSYPPYEKESFTMTLDEMDFDEAFLSGVLAPLPETFSFQELVDSLGRSEDWPCPANMDPYACSQYRRKAAEAILWAAMCDYIVQFPSSQRLSERVLFPSSPREEAGMEDARFVLFADDDGSSSYLATYAAYDGDRVIPQLVETSDFVRFRVSPLHGKAARNKGMALFPRKIGGRYAMLGRQGGESISIMFSDELRIWDSWETLLEPEFDWEFMQIGNCGSPIETEHGWLVLTHGVGTMRNYAIGAALLDLEDPLKVLGRLERPLLEPLGNERDGYVPNVVYSCGALTLNGWLVLPYAVSDYATTVAVIALEDILARLR